MHTRALPAPEDTYARTLPPICPGTLTKQYSSSPLPGSVKLRHTRLGTSRSGASTSTRVGVT